MLDKVMFMYSRINKMISLPTLYKLDSKGRVCYLDVYYTSTHWYSRSGILSKRDTHTWKPRECKSITKELDKMVEDHAHSFWKTKKRNDRMSETIDEAMNRPKYQMPIVPAALLKLDDAWKRSDFSDIEYLAEAKLDGNRATAGIDSDGTVKMFTRNRKEHMHNEHIKAELQSIYNTYPQIRGMIFDGELINEEMDRNALQSSNYRINKTEEQKHHMYVVFDIVCDDTYANRRQLLSRLLELHPCKYITMPKTYGMIKPSECKHICDVAVKEGYEGLVLKRLDGLYPITDTRTSIMLKVKPCEDREYVIVGASEGVDAHKGLIIFTVKDEVNGVVFNVTPKFNHTERRSMWVTYCSQPTYFIGRYVTVRYKCLNKYNVPEEAVMIRFRDDHQS